MEKIKHFLDCYIPVTTCTLRCHYCYITQHRLFEAKPIDMPYSAEHVRKAMSKNRLGGTCLINFCAGGETLITRQVLDYAYALAEEGHYVMIVTNATVSKRFEEVATWPREICNHIFFKFSYHYIELKTRGWLERFFDNIRLVRDAGCSFTVEITPSDELIPLVDECNERCVKEVGAVPHVTIARDERNPEKLPILTNMSTEDYYKFWGEKFNSSLFDFKKTIYEVPRKEFCYAGRYSAYIHMGTGLMTQCYCSTYSQNIFADVSKPINWIPIGRCLEHHCYNGHVWIVLGDIPGLANIIPTYAEERNRICTDGSEWLQPEMKAFMSTRMYDNNEPLSAIEKEWYLLRNKTVLTILKIQSLVRYVLK